MIVVDSSAVVDALIVAPGSEALRERLAVEELHASTLLDFELVSALRGLTLAGRLSATRAEDALGDFDDLPIERWPFVGGLRLRAFQLRENVSAYDAAFLALAEALECPLLTRDRLLGAVAGSDATVEIL